MELVTIMKIGYFNTFFPYKNPLTDEILVEKECGGGVENVAYNLTVKMMELGHEIYFFSSAINRTESIEKYQKITIYRYKKSFNIGRSPVSFDFLYKPLQLKINPDIIHAHLGNLPAPLTAYWFAKKKNKPFIITYHGDHIGQFGDPLRRTGVFLHRLCFADFLLSKADVIIALSEYNVNESKYLKKYREKITVIPNGINLEEFNIPLSKEEARKQLDIPLDKKIILFVGNLIQIKAPDVLIDAMKKIVKEIPESHLIFVGDGVIRSQLEIQIKKLGIETYVTFVGSVIDTYKKVLYYKAADVFVLPSFSEGFPIVLLEASACGLPLVVSGLESFRSIVRENYNGLFSKTGDQDDLANKIIFLLQNEDVIKKYGKNAKEKVKTFTWNRIAKETEKLYFDIIGN